VLQPNSLILNKHQTLIIQSSGEILSLEHLLMR